MDISVIMSAYNASKYINKAIESILNQTFTYFEFIIVDDCSSDNTLNILEEYAKKDNRIIIIRNETNIGLTKSLNKGIKQANGKYIARMDADDISHIQRLEKQFYFLERNEDIDILGTCGADVNDLEQIICDRTVPLTHKDILKTLTILSPIIHPSVMFRKNRIQTIGNYNPEYRTAQDIELWFRCAEAGYKFANLPDKLIYYRVDEGFFKRKSFQSRIRDFKIKSQGYDRLKVPMYKRHGLLIPIIMALMPAIILKRTYKVLKRLDPR